MALTFDEDVKQRRAQQQAMIAPPAQTGFAAQSAGQEFLAAPPTLGSGLNGMTKPNPNLNFVTTGTSGVAPVPVPAPGRNADGVITADSAQAAYGADMKRPGGVFGTMDLNSVNAIDERANKARGGMIDSMIAAQGGNGVAILPDNATLPGGVSVAEWNKNVGSRSALDSANAMSGMGSRTKATYMAAMANNEAQRRGQDIMAETSAQNAALQNQSSRYTADINAQRAAGHDQVLMRGQDMTAANEVARIAGNPIDNKTKQLQLDVATMSTDLQKQYMAEQDQTKKAALAEQIRVLGNKDKPPSFSAIHAAGGTYFDPKNSLQPLKSADTVYRLNNQTGEFTPMTPGQQQAKSAPPIADFAAQVRAKNPGQKVTDEQIQQAYKQQFGG